MASIHESFEYSVNEVTELFDTSMITGVIITVDHDNNTADVEIDGLGAVSAIPIHYHCEGATTVDDGHLAFTADDEVLIWAKSLHEMKIVGFPDGIKACGEFVYVEYGSFCFVWNPVDDDYAKIKKADKTDVTFPALKSEPAIIKWFHSTQELETNECYPSIISEGVPSIAFEANSPFIEETKKTQISPGDICVFSDIIPGLYNGDMYNAYGLEQKGNISYYDDLNLEYKSKHQTYFTSKTCGSTECRNPPWCTETNQSIVTISHHEINTDKTAEPLDYEMATWDFPAVRSQYDFFTSKTLISNLGKRSGFYVRELGYTKYKRDYESIYLRTEEDFIDTIEKSIECDNSITYEYYSPFGKMDAIFGFSESYATIELETSPFLILNIPHKEQSRRVVIAKYSEKTMVQVFLIQALLLDWYEKTADFGGPVSYHYLRFIHSYTKPFDYYYDPELTWRYDGDYMGTSVKEEAAHAACGSYLSDDISQVEPSDQGRNFGFESALVTLMETTTDIYDLKVEIRKPKIA